MLDKTKTYSYDSRLINSGDSFICLPKGERYIEEALEKGAIDVVHLSRDEFATCSNEYFDYPSDQCCLIGITGTNGKTSVTYFVQQLLQQLGHKVLVIGTLNASLTTPESWDILKRIKDHVDNGGTHVVLEVSSHGIDQKRVYGLEFDVKYLTNITQDHLDYHGTFEHYKQTKMSFMKNYPGKSIYSKDIQLISAEDIAQFSGQFHLENISGAIEICKQLGCSESVLLPLLSTLKAPEGRFELINFGQPYKVIIDFAHTPDGLNHVLSDALSIVDGDKNKLKVVFGCGGERDESKRKKMGEVAERYSNKITLTEDNSRSENTLSIIEAIKDGIEEKKIANIFEDRHDAIQSVIKDAVENDVIVIAGKGHETYQIKNGYSHWFNDRVIAMHEIIHQSNHQLNQTWVLNKPDAATDVLFISKNLMKHLKISYSQFKRAMPTPSTGKIDGYLKKIRGQKVLIFEQSKQISMSQFFVSLLKESGGCTNYFFDDDQSFEHNISGLTLIDQTSDPIVIKVNPLNFTQIKKIIDIIQPDHIIIGDIYNSNRYIEVNLLKAIHSIISDEAFNSMFWWHEGMSDISDYAMTIKDKELNFHMVNTFSWIEYMQFVAEDILIKLDRQIKGGRNHLESYLLSKKWYQKVSIHSLNKSLIILDWNADLLELRQKLEFLDANMSALTHFICVEKNIDELIVNLSVTYQVDSCEINIDKQVVDYIDTNISESVVCIESFSELFNEKGDQTIVVWKSMNQSMGELMGRIL